MVANGKLSGALRWSAAEEVAVRLGAVKSQVKAAAEDDNLQENLRSGLVELDSIRQFIHDGINSCNRVYLDSGSKDAVLHAALERGLHELEEVRSKLVETLTSAKRRPSEQTETLPMSNSMRRPPSAPSRLVQKENEAKRQQRALNESQRKQFLERSGSFSGQQQVNPPPQPPAASSSTATQPGKPFLFNSRQTLKTRPMSATVRSQSQQPTANVDCSANATGSGRRPEAAEVPLSTNSPTPPATQPPTQPAATGTKFRPSSAPAQRSKNSDSQQQQQQQQQPPAKRTASPAQPPLAPASASTSNPNDPTSTWGKYQDWAQSVLSRVQSRRVMQHRQSLQKQREDDQQGEEKESTTPPLPPQAGSAKPKLAQGIYQGNLRRPQTAGMTPSSSGGHARPQSAKLTPQAQLLREQGNVFFQQKRYKESADAYSRALDADPQSETLFCNRAAAYLMMNRFSDALSDSLRAIDIDPVHVKAHWRAAKAYLYLGQSAEAKEMYAQAHKLADVPTEADAIDAEMKVVDLIDKCRRCLRLREWQEALRAAEQILDVFPPSGPCSMPWQCLRAEAMIFVDPHEASTILAQMCADDPTCAEAWHLRARALFYTGHDGVSTNTCISYLQKSREQDATGKAAALQACIEAFAKLRDEGNAAYSAGRWQDAYVAYTKCLTVDPYNNSLKAIILCNRAAVCIQCERWRDALDDINQSIGFNSNNAKAYTRRARIHQHNNSFDAAIKDLQTAVQMYPSAENQERLAQAIELKNQANRQQQQQQQQRAQPPPSQGGSFRYFGFASSGPPPQGAQRPSTAGTKRPQSAGYGGESNNSNNQSVPPAPKPKSLYDVLSVTRQSDERTIVKAYRDAALKWHPDKWAAATAEQKLAAENVFKEVSVAYNVLKDAAKRRQYDLTSTY
jgi:tetratricopeptide (TPR) repeat protein